MAVWFVGTIRPFLALHNNEMIYMQVRDLLCARYSVGLPML